MDDPISETAHSDELSRMTQLVYGLVTTQGDLRCGETGDR